jgi:hypothetical protein
VQTAPWVQAVHTPPMPQTPLPPPVGVQGDPTATSVLSVQTGAPLEQLMVAVAAHGLVDVQLASGEQAVQVPLVPQTPLVVPCVHGVPGVWNVWSVQTGAPLVQLMVAVASQTLLEVHAAPCVHALHTPVAPLHTPATPPEVQANPADWNVWSLQTGAPVEQSIVAVTSQGFDDVQVAPCVQEMQDPVVLQTPVMVPEVHPVPAALKVWSVQTGAPLPQAMVAVASQGFEEVQLAPALHCVHTPAALHTPATPPVVHDVPTVTKVWSVQTGAPLLHTMEAVASQGFEEVQAAPALHGVHTPAALHTPAAPPVVHDVPTAAKVWSVQTGRPEEQTVTADVAQGLVEVQEAPHRAKFQTVRSTPLPWVVQSMV